MNTTRNSLLQKIIIFAIPCVLFISIWVDIKLPAEADKGWLLHVARLCLQGHILYKNIIEINPPLIVWLYEIPAWIALHTSFLKDSEALGLLGLLLSLLSIAVSGAVIKYHEAFAHHPRAWMKFTLLIALIIIFFTTQIYFCDREHIFWMFTLPYLLRLMPTLEPKRFPITLRICIGSMAAFGFCIKPHTIIVFIAVQLFLILRTKSFTALLRLENYLIAAGAILYAFCIWHFTPDYLRVILPMAMATYSDFGNPESKWLYLPPIALFLALIFADFKVWFKTPFRPDIYYFIGLCGAFFIYMLVNNGWGYTYLPLYCMVTLTAGWMTEDYMWLKRDHAERGLPTRRFVLGERGCIIVFLLQSIYMLTYSVVMAFSVDSIRMPCDGRIDCWESGPYTQYIREQHIQSFGTVSLDFSNWVALMRYTGASWETRFNHLWMMPKLMGSGPQFLQSHQWIVDFVAKGYADDLNINKPDLMLVDSSPGIMGRRLPIPWVPFFSTVPEFKAAWSHYHYTKTLGHCPEEDSHKGSDYKIPSSCQYDVYIRMP